MSRTVMRTLTDDADRALRHHGDRDTAPGLVDLAVNVRSESPPPWLRKVLAEEIGRLGRYPDPTPAVHAVARRHGRDPRDVLLTHGAAEAFVLLARALHPRLPVVVHPQFTEPEAALRDVGCPVERVVLAPPFRLADATVPDDADLVVVGNPTNPTSVLHPVEQVRRLARPGRTLVVDEAFMDGVPGETASLAADRDTPGLVVVRSLTKQFSLAGLRIGYVLADSALVERVQHGRPLWPVSSPALAAARACVGATGVEQSRTWAREGDRLLARCVDRLDSVPGVEVTQPAAAPFVLLRVPDGARVRARLRDLGFGVRRCDTFPGLGPDWIRVAVRDDATNERFARALADAVPAEPAEGVDQCW
ncbi:MAG TPA: Rv2231c family pyridoxal phosphate-dependent protein CobC [Nocardioidaceae bacterium]|nr:Rv2231c family pyridoxal phosphate-dependent protein CobC [Nocardioidaceae bacterium]